MQQSLIPAIEQRFSAFMEVSRRAQKEITSNKEKQKPTVTISREFGCEGYPLSEKLKLLLEKKTGETWTLMDRGLLEEVARNHKLSEEILQNLGSKNQFLDEAISTFSSLWKSDKDYYRLLCRHIITLAEFGNVIIVGRGGAVVTQSMKNCFHFRIIAPEEFKVRSISTRLGLTKLEAQEMIHSRQKQRDKYSKDFLNCNLADPIYYHLVFNNAKNSLDKIAETIVHYMF